MNIKLICKQMFMIQLLRCQFNIPTDLLLLTNDTYAEHRHLISQIKAGAEQWATERPVGLLPLVLGVIQHIPSLVLQIEDAPTRRMLGPGVEMGLALQ